MVRLLTPQPLVRFRDARPPSKKATQRWPDEASMSCAFRRSKRCAAKRFIRICLPFASASTFGSQEARRAVVATDGGGNGEGTKMTVYDNGKAFLS